ncbi:DUF6712 family protein [uncultured Bacteroides sp.]|uniref:DUF6712 family protein n=1 Tax=uncultured Bacteroides sp. TaxID=162156 RepID=UPI002AA5E41E|nr:DUF6712 family protein [uncultured Bacteroides sp.]
MIFNKSNNGSQELREVTGNYFANNKFEKVTGEIAAATDELVNIISQEVYSEIEGYYTSNSEDSAKKELVRKVQRPIAIFGTLRMYQKNDVSHEDSGRKIKISADNEKLPWEWQLDRDDAQHLEDYYKAVDVLIRALNVSSIEAWKNSRSYKMSQLLLIKSGEDFDSYFPIEKSERTYMLLVPFIKEAQIQYVKKAYGPLNWEELLQEKVEAETEKHFAACKATALLAMSLAMRRLQVKVIPAGVIRTYVAESGAMNSEPASYEDIKLLSQWMNDDAMTWLDEMKKERDGGVVTYQILPNNDPANKFCRL